MSWATVVDHLGLNHFGIANALALAVRRHLSPDHPLRRLLKPFTYRTAAINERSLRSMLPPGGLLHRASGLTWESQCQLYGYAAEQMRYTPLPDDLRARGVHPSQLWPEQRALVPFSLDGLDFWQRIEAFVQRSFAQGVALRAVLSSRHQEQTRAFYDDLCASFDGTLPPLGLDGLVRTLTWLIYSVSGLHSHLGYVAPYVRDPDCAAARVWRNATRADAQNVLQMNVMAVATALPVPTIGDDFRHLMPDPGSRRAADRLRSDMAELDRIIDVRNAHRETPFTSFQPRWIPCSVSR